MINIFRPMVLRLKSAKKTVRISKLPDSWWPELLDAAQVQSLHKEVKTAEVMMLSDGGSGPFPKPTWPMVMFAKHHEAPIL